MTKIVGETLKPYVIDQIKIRQGNKGHGSGVNSQRESDTLMYLNSKTAFVNLASSVYISPERIADEKLIKGNHSFSLAKNYVLSGGVSRLVGTNDWTLLQRSTGYTPQSRYSGAYNVRPQADNTSGLINNPMPGIIDVNIQPINRGSITKAKVNIKCYTPEQFQLIDLLYMRLGYTVFLEWGNSKYLNNNGSLTNMKSTLIEDEKDGFFSKSHDDFFEFSQKIEKYREDHSGNYDALLCKVTNMHWEFNQSNGVYDIQLDLTSQGDVVESFKLNTTPSVDIFQKYPNEFPESEKESSDAVPDVITQFLQIQKFFQKKKMSTVKNEISIHYGGNKYKYFGHFIPTPGKKSKINQYSDIFGIYGTYKQGEKDCCFLNTMVQADNSWYEGKYYETDNQSYYIRFGYLLQFLEEFLIPTMDNTNKTKIIKLNTKDICPMYKAPYQMSFDPRVCIVNNTEKLNTKHAFPELIPWVVNITDPQMLLDNPCLESETSGDIMNIYLNFNEIENSIQSNIDDKGVLNTFEFLNSLCLSINKAMGGVNNLEPFIDENNTLYIIDSSFVCGALPSNPYALMLYGYNKTDTESTFVRNFSIKSEITPELATMITVGATSKGYVKGTENTMFSKWNQGIRDRFKENYYIPNEVEENKPEEIVEKYVDNIFDKSGFSPFGYENISGNNEGSNGLTNAALALSVENIEKNLSTVTEFYKYLSSYVYSEDPDFSSPTNGFIPISLNVTMDGMSGIKLLNSVDTETRFLSKRYPENLNFIIKGISHKLSNQDWETTFQTIVTAKSTKDGKKYPYKDFKAYTDALIKKYSSLIKKSKPTTPYIIDDFEIDGRLNDTVIKNNFKKATPSTIAKGKSLVIYFQSQLGIDVNQSAALVGNLIAESGLIPNRIQGVGIKTGPLSKALPLDNDGNPQYGKVGYGWAQWTYETRQKDLEKFIGGKNVNMNDAQNKGFILKELLVTGPKTTLSNLKTIKGPRSLELSVIHLMSKYENPADQSPEKTAERINYAKQLL